MVRRISLKYACMAFGELPLSKTTKCVHGSKVHNMYIIQDTHYLWVYILLYIPCYRCLLK